LPTCKRSLMISVRCRFVACMAGKIAPQQTQPSRVVVGCGKGSSRPLQASCLTTTPTSFAAPAPRADISTKV
jgi:hypothetical protein